MVLRWLLIAVAAFPLLGCTPIRVARECQKLADIVASGLQELEQATRPRTPAAYRAAGSLYRKIADQLRLTVGSKELRVPTEDYARVIEALGPNVRAYADALEAGDATEIETARGEVERASRREQMASRRLENECHRF